MRLPDPMLARPGSLPLGSATATRSSGTGFRAIACTENGLRVRSRRGWDMTALLPELAKLPSGLSLDGELVAPCSDDLRLIPLVSAHPPPGKNAPMEFAGTLWQHLDGSACSILQRSTAGLEGG